MKRSTLVLVLVAFMTSFLSSPANAQFAWDGDCSILWTDCCNYGTPENPEWRNNWTVAPNFTTCPALPGVNDDVFAGGTIMLNQNAHVKSLSQSGTFLFAGNFRSLIADNELSIHGTITEPTTFVIQGAYNFLSLWNPDTSATINAFATLEYQASGAVSGPASSMLYNNGTIWKTAESSPIPGFPPFPNSLNIPVENNGTISCWVGTLTLGQGGTNNGVIEALGEGIVAFKGPADYLLDGEVRGDGLIRFLSTSSGGGVSIVGDYHPTNTLIAGGYLPVNFNVNTHIENLTLDNPGILGGKADLTIDNLTWYGTTGMTPGGTTIVLDTALFQKDAPNNGALSLNRDIETHGESVFAANTTMYMQTAEWRNYGDFQMHGNSVIGHINAPDTLVRNMAGGTFRKVAGSTSVINVEFFNLGDVVVESGTLHVDGLMLNDAAITVNAGTTLRLGHKQQSSLDFGSITGEGTVHFYSDYKDAAIDVMHGLYEPANTIIQDAKVEFQADAVTQALNMIGGIGKLLGDANFTVTEQLNWSAGEMAGAGTTLVYGPMILTGSAHLDRTLELNIDAPAGKQLPNWTMYIKPLGTLRTRDVTVDGHVNNSGVITPGVSTAPTATLHFTGGYAQNPDGELVITKTGPVHDQLVVDGAATLNGTLTASGFPTSGGQSFSILTAQSVSGTFSQTNLPVGMTVSYMDTSVVLHAAPVAPCPPDISNDGQVNVIDLLAVINAWGPCADPNNCPADINGDDIVNVLDLLGVVGAWGPCP